MLAAAAVLMELEEHQHLQELMLGKEVTLKVVMQYKIGAAVEEAQKETIHQQYFIEAEMVDRV